jgi:DedD protein
MAERKAADDTFNPRHRIVGAVILVALAVIFLPMFLSERPPESRTTLPGAMPTPESRVAVAPSLPMPDASVKPTADPASSGMRSVTIPVGPASTRTSVSPAVPAPPEAIPETTKATTPVPTAPRSTDTKPASEPKAAKTVTASSNPVASSKGKWIVQVGVFSQPENARRLQNQLKQKGYSVSLDPPKAASGTPVRVEVGPYRDEAAARTAAARLQTDLGIKGIVRKD